VNLVDSWLPAPDTSSMRGSGMTIRRIALRGDVATWGRRPRDGAACGCVRLRRGDAGDRVHSAGWHCAGNSSGGDHHPRARHFVVAVAAQRQPLITNAVFLVAHDRRGGFSMRAPASPFVPIRGNRRHTRCDASANDAYAFGHGVQTNPLRPSLRVRPEHPVLTVRRRPGLLSASSKGTPS
jgi:hypothetical protein